MPADIVGPSASLVVSSIARFASPRSNAAMTDSTRDDGALVPHVSNLTPFVHVTDVVRSVGFYALLGFDVRATFEPRGSLVWAYLESEQAQLMLALADQPINQACLLYTSPSPRDISGSRMPSSA